MSEEIITRDVYRVNDTGEERRIGSHYPRFCSEVERELSFAGWPRPYLKPEMFSAAGFFYMGLADEVTCFECGVELHDWKLGENPMAVHALVMPQCRYVTRKPCGNIPKEAEQMTTEPDKSYSQDVSMEMLSELEKSELAQHPAHDTSPLNTSSPIHEDGVANAHGKSRELLALLNKPIIDGAAENAAKIMCEMAIGYRESRKEETSIGQNIGVSNTQPDKRKASDTGIGTETPPKDSKGEPTPGSSRGDAGLRPVDSKPKETGAIPATHDVTGRVRNPVGTVEGNELEIRKGSLPARQSVIVTRLPKRRDYANYDARIASFTDWPTALGQTAEEMADAGFFYEGAGDKVRCFFCGGNLHQWAINDTAWGEHARWYKTCEYVIIRKGEKFIERMSQEKPTENPSLAEVMNKYRTFCKKRIQPDEADRPALGSFEKKAYMERIPKGYIATGVRIDDVAFQNLCRYCGERRVGGIYAPCAHAVACYRCAKETLLCDICGVGIDNVKEMVILPDRFYDEYEQSIAPLMIQEANDLVRATVRILQALGKKRDE